MYIIISLLSFTFAFLTLKMQFVENFEYQLTDAAKFALKRQKKYSLENRDLINSEIIILGITESSQFHYLNNIYGQYPWPREAYADFLRYFRLDEPNLYPLSEEIEDLKLTTWNSIRPDMLFFDIFFDSPRNTKLSFQNNSITKDFGKLIQKLNSPNKNTNTTQIFKEWAKTKKYESDNKFYNELAIQKKYDYIFTDYIIGANKEGRLSEQNLQDRLPYLLNWKLTNVYNEHGKKIDAFPAEHINNYPYFGLDIKLPLKNVIKNTAGTGAANIHPDNDGKSRKIPLIYRVYDERVMAKPIFLPTISLILAAKYYKLKPQDIIVNIGKNIILKNAYIKKRMCYTKTDKYNRTFKWSEYIDPFMEYIINKIIYIKNKNKNNTLKYIDIINYLIQDEKTLEILKEKYKTHKLKTKITPQIYEKEIKDFLLSLSLTSLYSKTPFFELENNAFTDIKIEKLSNYMKSLKNKYDILEKLVKKEVNNNKTNFLFIDDRIPQISIKNVKSTKQLLFDLIARLSEKFLLYDHKKLILYNKILYEEQLIPNKNSNKIINTNALLIYKHKINDELFKEYINYLLTLNKIPAIIEKLKNKRLIYYKELDKDFFDISITDTKLSKLIYLDEGSTEQRKTLNELYSIIQENKENTKNLKDILLYISGGYSNNKNQDLKLFYTSLKESYNIKQEFTKKIISTLMKKGLILYKEKKQKVVLLEIPDLEKIDKYKNNEILNLNQRKIIQSIIEASERLKATEGKSTRYYTFNIKEILEYLSNETNINKDKIKDILAKTSINKITNGNIETIKIKITDKDLGIKEPIILINYINRLNLQIDIIKELIKIKKKHSSLIGKLFSKKEKHNFYLYETLSEIGKAIELHPANILIEIEYLLLDPKFMETIKKIQIKDKDKIIRTNTNILNSYLNKNIDIKIPINIKGEMIINYQGPHKSFENSHFGKYMSTSRLRYSQAMEEPLAPPFNMATETPHLNWELFKNKIVFIGFYTTSALGQSRDYFETPYGTLFGVEIHANVLNTILKRDFIQDLPRQINLLYPIKISKQIKLIWYILSIVVILSFIYFYYLKEKNIRKLLKQVLLPILLFAFSSYILFYILNNGVSINYETVIMLVFSLLFGIILPKISITKGFVIFVSVFLSYFGFVVFYAFSTLKMNIPLVGTSASMIYSFIAISVYKLITEEKEKRKIRNMFSKYVSPDLVKQLVDSSRRDLELGGEDKEITVLFSDIRGFTGISENLKPYELVAHLNVYFTNMTDIIQKHSGTLDKYIGDAVMAFWGAPVDIEKHALLACNAALDMIDKLDKLNQSWTPEKRFNIGIGINTGTMTVGNIGSLSRMDYTIMGDSVNLCSRVEGANKIYGTSIIITEYTYKLVKNNVIVRELDLIKVIGKEQPVRIYELLDIRKK